MSADVREAGEAGEADEAACGARGGCVPQRSPNRKRGVGLSAVCERIRVRRVTNLETT